jgi:hypothetical protein
VVCCKKALVQYLTPNSVRQVDIAVLKEVNLVAISLTVLAEAVVGVFFAVSGETLEKKSGR